MRVVVLLAVLAVAYAKRYDGLVLLLYKFIIIIFIIILDYLLSENFILQFSL